MVALAVETWALVIACGALVVAILSAIFTGLEAHHAKDSALQAKRVADVEEQRRDEEAHDRAERLKAKGHAEVILTTYGSANTSYVAAHNNGPALATDVRVEWIGDGPSLSEQATFRAEELKATQYFGVPFFRSFEHRPPFLYRVTWRDKCDEEHSEVHRVLD